jgi:2-polyprenyl-3-methyl-5-hydroxy-6-metoxy-1,4-benzoquinol methylase
MNRRMRRANLKTVAEFQRPAAAAPAAASLPPSGTVADLYATAAAHYRSARFAPAQALCHAVLQRQPDHVPSLVLLGDIAQQQGRNQTALKLLGRALALDAADTAAHDTMALAYQALGRRDEAVTHFTKALALGLAGAETLIKQSAAVAMALRRLAAAWPRQLPLGELLDAPGPGALAAEPLLLAHLQCKAVFDVEFERLLTAIRRGLLQRAIEHGHGPVDGDALTFMCALARQCFINDYAFPLGETEGSQAQQITTGIARALELGADIAPFDVAVAASYAPLCQLPGAAALLERRWPEAIARLLTQQIREPLEELADRSHIPALTPVEDATSLQVQSQYEESPYPRWAMAAPVRPTTIGEYLADELGGSPPAWPRTACGVDILVAGCGTGAHSIDTALRFPRSRILAVDISRASLAYARRHSRALGLGNVAYGQADILKLDTLDRRFDVIEAVGVLHHLRDPGAGWRLLVSLLRPDGLMFVGLYSALARRSLAAARALIAERGYRATAADIRACRHDLIARGAVPPFRDFASLSGCRDLLFNVMEHHFTIPQIADFLAANKLTFLGFAQLPAAARQQFGARFPNPAAARDLAAWHAFEQTQPLTFGNMYFFWLQKSG